MLMNRGYASRVDTGKHTDGSAAGGVTLGTIALALGVRVLPARSAAAPAASAEPLISQVAVVDPTEEPSCGPGDLAFVVGARGVAAIRAACGAEAAVIKLAAEDTDDALCSAAGDAGLRALAILAPEARWDHVESIARALLEGADQQEAGAGDLFSLMQTVAQLTGGIVSLEDTGNHVVAYSRSAQEADELRRLSIMGHTCPESYLDLLRQHGVYKSIYSSDEPVRVEPRPELGARRRLAVGVLLGPRPLGSIWVQEGAAPLHEGSAEVLRGAARVAARHMVGLRNGQRGTGIRQTLTDTLLTGRFNAKHMAAELGVDTDSPVAVIALDLRDSAERVLAADRRVQAAQIAGVHAAAFRPDALVAEACGQIYVLLPGAHADHALAGFAHELVTVLRRVLATPAQAAVGPAARTVAQVPEAKHAAWEMTEMIAGDPARTVALHEELRVSLTLRRMLSQLTGPDAPRLDAVASLVLDERGSGRTIAQTLRLYLECLGSVSDVAERMHVHANTVRYRIRRAENLTGMDFTNPDHQLAALIQLRLSEPGGTGAEA